MILFLFGFNLKAQEIELSYQNENLVQVIEDLKSQYSISVSYNPSIVEQCEVSIQEKYSSIIEALKSLSSICGLIEVKFLNGVYVFSEIELIKVSNKYRFRGKVVDQKTGDVLAYSSILVGNTGFSATEDGYFNFEAISPKLRFKASYIGYELADTLVEYGEFIELKLNPKGVDLNVVEVRVEDKGLNNEAVGEVKVNHEIASFLPGSNNNTLYNLLRLQPGILAAGEQTQDYFIWGSYKGQSQVKYDEMTLYSSGNRMDDIGVINPLMIRHVNIYKGAYSVEKGDRIGGLVELKSKNGNIKKWGIETQLNNDMLGSIVNVPLGRSTFQLASRHYLKGTQSQTDKDNNDLSDQWTYNFRDQNIKLYHQFRQDYLKLSYFNSYEDEHVMDQLEVKDVYYILNSKFNKRQKGYSFQYYDVNTSNLLKYSIVSSTLKNAFDNSSLLKSEKEDENAYRYTHTDVNEFNFKIDYNHFSKGNHSPKFGLSYLINGVGFRQDSTEYELDPFQDTISRLQLYGLDLYSINNKLSVEYGLKLEQDIKVDYPVSIQPRFSLNYIQNKSLKWKLSGGRYQQFVYENSYITLDNDQVFFWELTDASIPLTSLQSLFGAIWEQNKVTIETEVFYKNIDGLTRLIEQNEKGDNRLYKGQARAYGLDLFVKKRFAKHEVWSSYTLSKTEEVFEDVYDEYVRSPQDQRHELKLAGIFEMGKFNFSINQVYGSGIPEFIGTKYIGNAPYYSRLDMALLYRIEKKKYQSKIGVSILNVLNRDNVRYNNFFNFTDEKVYLKAIGFTPRIFFSYSM